MLKRKLEKVTNALKRLLKGGRQTKKFLLCKECDEIEVEVAHDIKAVTCAYCVQRAVAPPPSYNKPSDEEKFPRGWALKTRYVHTDGRVFEKGKPTGETVTSEPSPQSKPSAKDKPTRKKVKKKAVSKRKSTKKPPKKK